MSSSVVAVVLGSIVTVVLSSSLVVAVALVSMIIEVVLSNKTSSVEVVTYVVVTHKIENDNERWL